jgi:hypothetical protein
VSVWHNKLKNGRTALNHYPEKRRGRPRTSHTDDTCVFVEGLIREDGRFKVREIAAVTCIAHSLERSTTVKECLIL